MIPRVLPVSIVLSAVAAMVGAMLGGPWLWLHYACKPSTTALILWMAASVASPVTPRYRRAVLAGMALSLIGDVLLMLPVDLFVPGLIAFLTAHIGYVVAFAPGSSAKARAGAFALLAGVAGANLVGLLPRIGAELKGPVLAYVAILASMAALALARAWTPGLRAQTPRSVRFAAAGGLCFVLSDSLLAWDKFGGGIPLAALWILSSYWIAQWCIARSVARS
ncbi:MAG: lysoplasmalogenase [Pseudomonadota bacterium]